MLESIKDDGTGGTQRKTTVNILVLFLETKTE